ncbi:MAG TPA: ATP-binding protein [Balneolaceae bacterium]
MLKNFRFRLIVRTLLLALTMAVCIYLWMQTEYYISAILLVLAVIYQFVRLIHFIELTNRKLTHFLDSIRYSDFSRSFSSKRLGKSFQELDKSFAEVVDVFKQQRIEKQAQFRYMERVVQHIGIGLITFKQNGEVELLNTAAKRLLQVATLRNIDHLNAVSESLYEAIKQLKGGGREVVRVSVNNKSLQLAIHATMFRLQDEVYKLVSLQDINPELEEKEMEAWQNLTQVLAHEIMNSVTPIASLSDTLQVLLKKHVHKNGEGYIIEKEAVKDVGDALETIENRSRGLIRFVNSYRDITKIPKPDVEQFSVKKLLQRAKNLNKGEAKNKRIEIKLSVEPETLEITADLHLIEQVLINLIKNAFRALKNRPDGIITLRGEISSGGGVSIYVHDNGPGISSNNLDKIFIPFYSTRRPQERSGTGIGLSLSRQIMRAHGGSLTVKSSRKEGSTFTLWF